MYECALYCNGDNAVDAEYDLISPVLVIAFHEGCYFMPYVLRKKTYSYVIVSENYIVMYDKYLFLFYASSLIHSRGNTFHCHLTSLTSSLGRSRSNLQTTISKAKQNTSIR